MTSGRITCGFGEAIESLAGPAVMAATATATPRVAVEIANRLGLRDPVLIRSGFDRPNVTFDVASVEGKGAVSRKRAALMHVLSQPQSLPAIVYCGTRKDTDGLAAEIAAAGIPTVAYHAGLSPEQRRSAQESFMAGAAQVVVATNAFGMGVDKADVRTVAHWALPTSLEAYYQEAGRGGRDGRPARALLLASRSDLGRLIRFIKERETSVEDVRSYVGRLRRVADASGVLAIGHGALAERDRVLLSIAERAGAVELEPGGPEGLLVRLTGQGSPRLAGQAIKAARDRSMGGLPLDRALQLNGERCRRRQILDHFGDSEPTNPTGRCCDVCDPDESLAAAMAAASTSSRRRGASGRARGGAADVPDFDVPADQFEVLRVWRMERSEGKPAFTVATDASLRELLHRRPATLGEPLDVRGIGPSFSEKHGESVLELLGSLPGDGPS